MDSQFQTEYFNDCLKELENENFVPASEYSFMCDDDTMARWVFAGTVFNLTPSGKYYTPWANSNVDACPECHGKGYVSHTTCFKCKGSGEWYIEDCGMFECPECYGAGLKLGKRVCPTCDGLGSEEAYQDQLWQDAADKWADKHGVCIEPGEGDPCDVFIVEYK